MLYKGDKGVENPARPPEGGPAETGGHTASSLPLLDNARSGQSQQQFYAVGLDAGAHYTRGDFSCECSILLVRFILENNNSQRDVVPNMLTTCWLWVIRSENHLDGNTWFL